MCTAQTTAHEHAAAFQPKIGSLNVRRRESAVKYAIATAAASMAAAPARSFAQYASLSSLLFPGICGIKMVCGSRRPVRRGAAGGEGARERAVK